MGLHLITVVVFFDCAMLVAVLVSELCAMLGFWVGVKVVSG